MRRARSPQTARCGAAARSDHRQASLPTPQRPRLLPQRPPPPPRANSRLQSDPREVEAPARETERNKGKSSKPCKARASKAKASKAKAYVMSDSDSDADAPLSRAKSKRSKRAQRKLDDSSSGHYLYILRTMNLLFLCYLYKLLPED